MEGRGADRQVSYPHTDRRGSTIALSRGGQAVATYAYDEYGQGRAQDGVTGYPFRYTGQRLDPYTGTYHYKAREYSPQLGRFLQADPARFVDGPNVYAYVGNNPWNATDPTGTEIIWRFQNGGTKAQAMAAVNYLRGAPTSAARWDAVRASPIRVYIIVDPSLTDGAGCSGHICRVDWNPEAGTRTGDGSIQSPALGLDHELASHIHDEIANPIQYTLDRLLPSVDNPTVSQHEANAVRHESQVANELGEPVRNGYDDVDPVDSTPTVPSVTTSCKAPSAPGGVC